MYMEMYSEMMVQEMKRRKLLLVLMMAATVCFCSCGRSVSVKNEEKGTGEEKVSESEKDTESETKKEKETKEADGSTDKNQKDTGAESRLLSVRTATDYESEYSDDYRIIASLKYATISLNAQDAKDYKELSKALKDFNKENAESLEEEYQSSISEAREELSNSSDYFSEYYIEEDIVVRRADTNVLSFVSHGSMYQGGAHGFYYCSGINYDVKTGERLILSDVVTDRSRLPELIEEQLDIFWKDTSLYEDLDIKEMFDVSDYEPSWVLDYNGLTIFFNPYEIAPFASGMQVVTLTYNEYPELIKEQYREHPEAYCVELYNGSDFFYDLDGDGKLDKLHVMAYKDEYDNYDQQSIGINNQWFEDDIDGLSVEPVFVHNTDGKNYLYIENGFVNDYGQLSIYNLNHARAEKQDMVYCGWHYVEEDGEWGELVFNNPESFILDTLTEVLSTATGYKNYYVNQNGMPAARQDWYDFGYYHELTLKKPLDVVIVDEATGKQRGSETLKEGTKVKYFRTDNSKYADLLLEDGRVARVDIERNEGMCYIDGVYIEEIFEGIVFAG